MNAGHGWYLVQTKPNAYRLAERNLMRQGIEVFLPLLEETQAQGARFVSITRQLFPGYLFVAAELGQLRSINGTVGVSRLVSFGATPARVPLALVEELRARCDNKGVMRLFSEFAAGDIVTFSHGPFSNLIATIDQIDRDHRIWLIIDLLGRPTRLESSQQQLKPIAI
jgi:transcriptional antiterminator RfaH